MAKKKYYLSITGIIESTNTEVVAGVFQFYDTQGLPLDVVFDVLKSNNKMPNWLSFVSDAKSAGWKNKTIKTRLSESISDVYGSIFRDEVFSRLEKFGVALDE